jgi:hypothetical protein
MTEIPIDGHHDHYRIELAGDEDWPRLSVTLRSRGSFAVNVDLDADDAEAFAAALVEAAAQAKAARPPP